jgi:hypothetical protein
MLISAVLFTNQPPKLQGRNIVKIIQFRATYIFKIDTILMYCFKLKPNFLYSILGQPCWFCNYQIHSICMLTCSRSLTRQVAKKKVSRKKVFLVLFPSPVSLRVCLCIRPRQALTKTCAFLSLHCFCAWHRDCQNRFQSFIHTRRYSERPGRVDI